MKSLRDPTEDYPLIRRAQAGDVAAREELFSKHQGFVHGLINRMIWRHEDHSEFVSIGYIKFVRAIEMFNCDTGNSLLTYAQVAIMEGIHEERRLRHVVMIPKPNKRISQKSKEKENAAKKTVHVGDKHNFAFDIGDSKSPADQCVERTQIEDIMMSMDDLPEQMRSNLIDRVNGITLKEIAKNNGYTREWARRLENAAVSRIRKDLDVSKVK